MLHSLAKVSTFLKVPSYRNKLVADPKIGSVWRTDSPGQDVGIRHKWNEGFIIQLSDSIEDIFEESKRVRRRN